MEVEQHFPVEGDRLRIRPVRPDDLDCFIRWDADEDIVRWSGKKFEGPKDAREWYFRKDGSRVSMAIETLAGRLIGEIELVNISWRLHTGELRVVIGEKSMWNRGFGQEAIMLFLTSIFKASRLQKIFLRVSKDNERAVRCYAKCGFKVRGVLELSPRYGVPRLLLMDISREDVGGFSSVPAAPPNAAEAADGGR